HWSLFHLDRRPLRSLPFPSTTLFRSRERSRGRERRPVLGELPVSRGAAPAVRVSPWLVAALATALVRSGAAADTAPADRGVPARSEEHTSELQSRGHLVCRLLLEKKK